LKSTGKVGALLAIGFSLPWQQGQAATITKIDTTSSLAGLELNPYILINDDGQIILFNARPDMGQGTYQSLPLLLAEELEVDLSQVQIRNTDGQGKYGAQLSGGSSSIRTRWQPMRKAGADGKRNVDYGCFKKMECSYYRLLRSVRQSVSQTFWQVLYLRGVGGRSFKIRST
jgi:isoquinoline 1-oxidoreductase beta subunit